MKKLIYYFVIFLFISCEKKEFTPSIFIIINNSDYTIDVYSTAVVASQLNGSQPKEIHDIIDSKQKISLRQISVSNDFDIKSVFSKFEIYRGLTKSTYEVMNKINWRKNVLTNGNIEYTLTVDNSFFK